MVVIRNTSYHTTESVSARFFEVVLLSYADMYSIDLLLACLTSVAVINSQINCSTYKLFKFR